MNIIEAIDDRNLLGASIRDPDSWKPWRALLAASFGLPLSSDELALYRQCTGRTVPPGAPASYLWLIIGRRGGKSFAMALIAVFLAVFKDWRRYLSPGERAIVLLVAADREQAKILHRYCQGILSAPILQSLVWNVTASEIELQGDAMVIAGSSPYARRGVLWDAFRRWHGKDDVRNLVWQAATRTMNPMVSQVFIDAEFERDAASANAEYGAEFRSDVAEFVSLEVLEACTPSGLFEIPPAAHLDYTAFVDPSGGSSDSMTLAIAHCDPDGTAVLDCIREVRAPFQPETMVDDFCKTLVAYGVTKVTGDRFAGQWPREQFKKRNVDYVPSERVKSDIYRDCLPLLNSRKCQLLDIRRLISQLHGLERRTARGGKDSIDHGPGQHDDVANACAGALVMAAAVTHRSSFIFSGVPTMGGWEGFEDRERERSHIAMPVAPWSVQ